MKKVLLSLLIVMLLTSVVFAGGGKEAEPSGKNKDLSILWQSGGNGDFVDYTAERLTEKYGLRINLEYNSKAPEILQPQIIAGNPPDIAMVQPNFFNYFAAIEAGAYTPLGSYLGTTVEGTDQSVYEVANSDVIEATKVDGEAYVLMSNMNVRGLYYNQTLFDKYGWKVPTTWDEFLVLCEDIKRSSDIAPFIYPGKYPYYLEGFVMPMIAAAGRGADSIKDINNMKKGIWKSPEVLEVARRIQTMRDRGYFARNLIALSHTESQMEFINGKAAMISAGSWLENEMGDNWPADFNLTYMVTPGASKVGDDNFVVVVGNLFGFPSAAKNKDWIGEFLATYYSPASALRIAKETAVVISPAMVAENADIRNVLGKSVVDSFMSANENRSLFMLYSIWYSEFYANYQNQLNALISGQINAEQFCENMEALAEGVRNDSSITKYSVT